MRARWVPAAAILLALGLDPGAGGAAGLREVGDGFLLDAADAAALLAPAGGPAAGAWFAVGQASLWRMPELPMTEVAAGLAWPRGGGALRLGGAWHRTGGGLLTVDRRSAWLGWEGAWSLQLTGSAEDLDVEGDRAGARTDWQLSGGPNLVLGANAELALRLWLPLVAPPAGARAALPVGRATLREGGAALALAWDRRGDGTPAMGAEFCLALAGRAALALRWDGASGSLGPGLALKVGPLLLRTSHAVHPVLGETHRFQLTGGALDAARR